MNEKVGRNDPCPCGSGKKYKQCCMAKERPAATGKKTFKASVIKTVKNVNLIERAYGASNNTADHKNPADPQL